MCFIMGKTYKNRKLFLGIDESNNGREPEFTVGVSSTNPNSIIKTSNLCEKYKETSEIKKNYLMNNNYSCVIFPKELINTVGRGFNVKLISYCELIKKSIPNEIIIDGGKNSYLIEKMYKALYPKFNEKNLRILMEAKADEKIPLVHRADVIARIIYRYYNRDKKSRKIKDLYLKHILCPQIRDYVDFLK